MLLLLVLLLTLLNACKKDDVKKDVTPFLPSNFPAPVYNFQTNPVTTKGFELGRKLFYDPILSRNNTISCGSCHQQFAAFVHAGHIVSHGIYDKLGKRNAPPVMNMAWSIDFFWDGGVHNLDLVPPNPIHNPVEMDEDFGLVIEKLQASATYPALFKGAFGTEEINSIRFLQALSQFMGTLVSANSRYDKYIRNEGGSLSSDELAGLTIFNQKCASCHATDLFTDRDFHNNGAQIAIGDSGRYAVTLRPEDIGKFKTPSLRNVEKTAPYMHNGKFQTLEQVLDHYATGMSYTPTLDSAFINGSQYGIPLTGTEKSQLISFLKTLTDDEFLHDSRFSEQ